MDKITFGKILIIISIIGLVFSISISSFTLIRLNNVYETTSPLFDKVDLIKGHIENFDSNLEEFNIYLKDIDTKEYMQKLSNIKSFVGTLNSLGLGGLVSGIDEDIDRFGAIINNIEELKLNLESARDDFSEIKSSLAGYEDVKQSIIGFVRTLRLYVLGMMIYTIILNGIMLYAGYYLLKSKE
ncbi:MAG: hypothetical protein HPY60_02280 [Candidatus Methanofastidiosum sp.]|mgnify:FL=1|nr:hypothetical protein [Methanofastidiosum sp.]